MLTKVHSSAFSFTNGIPLFTLIVKLLESILMVKKLMNIKLLIKLDVILSSLAWEKKLTMAMESKKLLVT